MATWLLTEDGQLVNTDYLRIIERSGDKIIGHCDPAGQVTLRRVSDDPKDTAEAMKRVLALLDGKAVIKEGFKDMPPPVSVQ